MSKERLEEIKNKYKEDVYDCKLGRFDIDWLIEQAERVPVLEFYKQDWMLVTKQNKRYREKLEEIILVGFYPCPNSKYESENYSDEANIAREAIEKEIQEMSDLHFCQRCYKQHDTLCKVFANSVLELEKQNKHYRKIIENVELTAQNKGYDDIYNFLVEELESEE